MTGIQHLSTDADEELADDQLPAGHTPVWIEPPSNATQVEMLERVETMAGQYQDVMVLYRVRQWVIYLISVKLFSWTILTLSN